MPRYTTIYGVTNEHAMGGESYFTHFSHAVAEATALVAGGETSATCTAYEVVAQPSKRGICDLLNQTRWVADSRELMTLTNDHPLVVKHKQEHGE